MYVCVCMYVCMYLQIPNAASIPEDIRPEKFDVKVHSYIRTYMHTYITYIHTYMHTYIHTYISHLPTYIQGKYGVSIVWSDGHFASIYTYEALEAIAQREKS